VRGDSNFLKQFNVIWVVQSFDEKYFASRFPQISGFFVASRTHKEGRFAIVTNVGSGMRWTLRLCVDERSLERTAKSCGPGAPTLALSFREKQRSRK
jgi:hypothetical protein